MMKKLIVSTLTIALSATTSAEAATTKSKKLKMYPKHTQCTNTLLQ